MVELYRILTSECLDLHPIPEVDIDCQRVKLKSHGLKSYLMGHI